ncbi:MAG: hydrogenase expression/synthesis HypA [Actinomycetia bacterium]|nr:hydrogenase expression/synthesis HypA [Actinomycetes bacterium]
MHELALSQAIAASVERHADGRHVTRVRVRIGHLRQVVPESLRFSWTLLTEGSALDGTELLVEHVPAVVACNDCAEMSTLDLPILVCHACHGHDVTLVSGDEFLIDSIDVMEVA